MSGVIIFMLLGVCKILDYEADHRKVVEDC